MTERSAEQAPVQTRPDHQDTARIPLAERLQRRISATDQRRASGQAPRSSGRVLPPPPPELTAQREREEAEREEAQRQAAEREAAQREAADRQAADRQAAERQAAAAAQAQSVQTQSPVVAPPARDGRSARRTSAPPVRGSRRARLRLTRIDPWSVMKVSFLLAIAFGI